MSNTHAAQTCPAISPEFRNFAFTLIFFLLLVFILTTSYFAKKHIYVVHSSLPLLVVAVTSSVVISLFSSKSIVSNAITNEFIYKYLLPVIVLAEGFNMRKRSLSTFKREVIVFSVVCPILACALNAAILYFSQKYLHAKFGLDPEKKLNSEILISIAITMSTVEIHGSVGPLHAVKNLRLYKILFTSGLFNNNMSLIIVMTFERMIHNHDFSQDSLFSNFLKVGCFSIGLGIAVGAAVSVVMKNTPNLTKNPMNETMFIIIGAYLAYSLAHLGFFQLSGDVAIFFYGVIVSHYTKYNMSETSFRNIGLSFNLIMQLAEAICFIYIGLGVGDAVIGHQENIYYALFILGVLFVSRSLVIGVTAIVLKSAKLLIEPREYFPIIMSGMIKGPMAYIFANVLVPFRSPCLDIKNHHQYIQSYPLFVMQICVIISLVVLTPLNYLVFRLFVNKDSIDLSLRASSKDDERTEFKKKILDGIWEINQKKPRVFEYVDEYFFKPSLIRDYHERRDEIEKMKVHFDALSGAYDHGVHLEHSILHGDGHHDHGDDHHGHGEDHHDHGSKEHGHGDDHHKNGHETSHKIEAHDSKNHDSKHHQKPHHDAHSPEATAHNHKHSSPPHESSVSITPKNTENLPDIGLDLPAPAKTASTPPPPTVTETQTPIVPVTTTTTAAATEQAAVPDRPEEPSVPVTDASVNTTVTAEAPKDTPPEN